MDEESSLSTLECETFLPETYIITALTVWLKYPFFEEWIWSGKYIDTGLSWTWMTCKLCVSLDTSYYMRGWLATGLLHFPRDVGGWSDGRSVGYAGAWWRGWCSRVSLDIVYASK